MFLSESLQRYVYTIVAATRDGADVALGASPRGALALVRAAQAAAAIDGRTFATPDDVKSVAPLVLEHRLIVRPEAELDGIDARTLVARNLGGRTDTARMNARPAAWVGPRGIVALALLAAGAGFATLVMAWPVVMIAVAIVTFAALAADAAAVARAPDIVRTLPPHLMLARRAALAYTLTNHGAVTLRFAIYEAPAAKIAVQLAPACGRLPPATRTTVSLGILPQERGRTEFGVAFGVVRIALGLRAPAHSDWRANAGAHTPGPFRTWPRRRSRRPQAAVGRRITPRAPARHWLRVRELT